MAWTTISKIELKTQNRQMLDLRTIFSFTCSYIFIMCNILYHSDYSHKTALIYIKALVQNVKNKILIFLTH
jgi:hypothetical protein